MIYLNYHIGFIKVCLQAYFTPVVNNPCLSILKFINHLKLKKDEKKFIIYLFSVIPIKPVFTGLPT